MDCTPTCMDSTSLLAWGIRRQDIHAPHRSPPVTNHTARTSDGMHPGGDRPIGLTHRPRDHAHTNPIRSRAPLPILPSVPTIINPRTRVNQIIISTGLPKAGLKASRIKIESTRALRCL